MDWWMGRRVTRFQWVFRRGEYGTQIVLESPRGKLGRSVEREEGHRLWKRDGVGEWFGIDCLSYG